MNLDNELKEYLSWAYEIGKKDGNGLAEVRKELKQVIEAYVTTRVKEAERLARIDELSHIGMDDDEIIVCYFTQENPDCSKDLSIGDRIAELEALTTTTNGKGE